MKYGLTFIFILIFSISGFTQDIGNFLEVKLINILSSEVELLKTQQNVNRTPPTESQLEDRQYNQENKLVADNQSVSVIFKGLSDKKIKSISFILRLTQNGKKIIERNIKDKPLYFSDKDFSVRDRFFSVKNLSFNNQNTVREVIIKQIVFEDGQKVKF